MYNLTNNVDIEIAIGKQMSATPRVILNDVKILMTLANTVDEIHKEIERTNGSDEGWLFTEYNDTFRFDLNDGILTSVSLSYSEQNKEPHNRKDLRHSRKVIGIPKLVQPQSFDLEPFEYRYCEPSDNTLLGYGDSFLNNSNQFTELQIAESISLIFNQDNFYCAWLVKNPELFLVNEIAPIERHISTPYLKESFWKVFQFINHTNIDLMEKQDMKVLNELAQMYRSIFEKKDDNKGLKILADKILNVADTFYSNEQMRQFNLP